MTVLITDHVPQAGEPVTGHRVPAEPVDRYAIPSPPGSRLTFRVAGIGVLLLAFACLVVANRMQGERVAGQPVATWPQPPPVGSCLDLDGGVPQMVPCAGPHDAEVTRAFGALDPMVTDTSRSPMYVSCDGPAADYLGRAAGGTPIPGSPDWDFLPLAYRSGPVDAPPDQRAGRYGWMVCVVQPAAPVRYRGTVRGISVTAAPVAYRWCLDLRNGPVSCAVPHATEVLATVRARRAAPPEPAARPTENIPGAGSPDAGDEQWARWLAECTELAGTLAGTTDPTYGGVLNVGISPLTGALQVLDRTDADADGRGRGDTGRPGAGPTAPGSLACISQVRDGRLLTGSVIGRGDTIPPLTGR